MFESASSLSNEIPFAEVIERLIASKQVEGIALFGSARQNELNEASDYDLLILIPSPGVHIFQMHTWIGGISADVVFVETELATRVLALDMPVSANSAEGFVISWMGKATILYENDEILSRVQDKIKVREWRTFEITASQAYDEWFWLNFDLRHIQRLAQSNDSIHLMTADTRLMACVSGLCRSYFRIRQMAWKGEKAGLRHMQEYDAAYFGTLDDYLHEIDRAKKIKLCEQLIGMTLTPIGKLWSPYSSAVYLQAPSKQPDEVDKGLLFWNALLSERK